MYDYSSMMALKELIAGEQERDLVENPFKGSMLNPGAIGADGQPKDVAKPHAKVQAKIGEKFVAKAKNGRAEEPLTKKAVDKKHQIWSEEQVAELPVVKEDFRKQPQFQSMYRQRVGTQDVYLGLSEVSQSSNSCQQIIYKIELPGAVMKDIQIDLNEKQMVVQTNKYYLVQYFQYKMDSKKAKAKFISDKCILELILPIIREFE